MALHGFHNLFMAPFPHCFVKQQNKSILVYSTSKEELIEFSDEASLILIQELYKNISLYKAFKRLAAKLRIPLKQLVEEADELIAYLKSARFFLVISFIFSVAGFPIERSLKIAMSATKNHRSQMFTLTWCHWNTHSPHDEKRIHHRFILES